MNLSYFILSRRHPRLKIQNNNWLAALEKKIWLQIYKRALFESEKFPPKLLEKLQKKRLLTILSLAQKSVPFYKKYLHGVRSITDFEKLKPLTKHDIRKAFERGEMMNTKLDRYKVRRHTSGSSGIPFVFYHDSNSYTKRAAIYQRMLRWIGYNSTQTDEVAIWIMRGNIHSDAGVIQFTASGPEEIEIRKNALYALLEGKKSIVHAMASHLVYLADMIKRDRKKFQIKGLISYGETLYPDVRKYLEEQLQAPVFDYYACQEIMNHGNECEIHDGIHVSSEWAYIEVLDSSNHPLPPGELGEIVVTSFENEVMPFIRYSLGDIGYWMKEPCPCGRTLPRLKVVGRSINHFIVLPNGTVGDFISLASPIIRRVREIRSFQIIRHSQFIFEIFLQPTEQFISYEAIRSDMLSYLGNNAQLSIKVVDQIPTTDGGKPRVFINMKNDLIKFIDASKDIFTTTS